MITSHTLSLNDEFSSTIMAPASPSCRDTGVDIYGLPLGTTVEERAERGQRATFWRTNPDLYVQRIRAALEQVKSLAYTDDEAMGLTGYCFGGSGVVFNAFSNSTLQVWRPPHVAHHPPPSHARLKRMPIQPLTPTPPIHTQVDVSFHGGLANKPPMTATPPMQPYLSYQSGGADESLVGTPLLIPLSEIFSNYFNGESRLTSSISIPITLCITAHVCVCVCVQEDIEWLQSSLSAMGGEWDITRYSRVRHGFTVWGPSSSAYHPRADGRSWAAMKVGTRAGPGNPAANANDTVYQRC
jgi:hypothetical protein